MEPKFRLISLLLATRTSAQSRTSTSVRERSSGQGNVGASSSTEGRTGQAGERQDSPFDVASVAQLDRLEFHAQRLCHPLNDGPLSNRGSAAFPQDTHPRELEARVP